MNTLTKVANVTITQVTSAQHLVRIVYNCTRFGKVKEFRMWTTTAQAVREAYPDMDIIAIQRINVDGTSAA